MPNSPDYLFSDGYKRRLEGNMLEFLDQRVIGLMRPA